MHSPCHHPSRACAYAQGRRQCRPMVSSTLACLLPLGTMAWSSSGIPTSWSPLAASLPSRVHTVAMSSTATSRAAGHRRRGYVLIHLCDAATGSAAQVLVGHRAPVWALSWSPREEYVLASGGADRSVRLWDIRRAGSCLKALDQLIRSTSEGVLPLRKPRYTPMQPSPRRVLPPAPRLSPHRRPSPAARELATQTRTTQ